MERLQPPEDDAGAGEKGRSANPKVRRRNRMITSCLECRRRKLKCDKLHPCTNCNKFSRDCLFLAPALDSVSQQRLNEIKEKMGSLERVLEQDVARREAKSTSSIGDRSQRRTSTDLPGGEESSSDNEAAVPEDEKGLEPTPLAVIDGAYEDDANDDVLDLGIKVGKMRLTERLGGFFRPRIGEEVATQLNDPSADLRTAEEKQSAAPLLPDHGYDFLAPGPTYIAPGSGFLFGDVGSKRSLINFLPAKGAADILIRKYYENVHFLARVVHWPSFQLHYDNFWTAVLAGLEPPAWQQAIVLSTLLSAVASMPEGEVATIFGRPKSTILGNFQTGTEVSLSKAQFLRATRLETLQALVIYLIPMCRDQISRAHSVIVGMAIRLAECMGLHRDPQDVYGLGPVDCHVRRMVWFQLCILDFRTCETQGPRPGIKREDYDTRFPLNINDADLLQASPQEAKDRWTDMTPSRIRFECIEMQRIIWFDRIRLEKKRVSLTHILGKIESFRRAMSAKYNHMFDLDVPIQKYSQLLMTLLIHRMYVMVLHRYLNNASNRVPERLNLVTVQSAVQACESAVAMERLPALEKWKWFSGVHQQWHMAFLLLTIIYNQPSLREADRVWNILDYVFEPDLSLSRTQRARTIIAAIRDRTTVYAELRKIRIPTSMKELPPNLPTAKSMEPTSVEASGWSTNASASSGAEDTPGSAASRQALPVDATHASESSWGFDSPATLYVKNYEPSGATHRRESGTTAAKITNPHPPRQQFQQQPQQQSPYTEPNQTSPGQQIDFNSPSDSGTNESWPPLITPDQVGWRTVLGPGNNSLPPIVTMHSLPPVTTTAIPQEAGGNPYGIGSGFPNDQVNIPQFPASVSRGDSIMSDINWAEWDQLFPPETTAGLFGAGNDFGMPQ
ncbi:hypothetical protein LTR99_005124 [Exophiala xenobiotica]|nr:hypothetical protein LTR96_003958 [Exophiala xenobiotica]KAK5303362.1 hypothetical protein LTR99_005124 [Exophiala xenobiotica]KAK5339571.1 hypothetical protein LTR98_004373 [Exophiala xenobiotica]KAK5436463.1 hypothetical protein LTR34_002094 [Exophiala xenobiotica]